MYFEQLNFKYSLKLRQVASSGISGYSFEVLRTPVSASLLEEVLVCLSELGDPWLLDIRIRLGDPPEKSDNLFMVCRDGSRQIVSNTWIGWNGGQPPGERTGLLGHVFTLLPHRRKGLATRVSC